MPAKIGYRGKTFKQRANRLRSRIGHTSKKIRSTGRSMRRLKRAFRK